MIVRKTRRPRRWVDPRLFVGVLLIAGSIIGVATVLVAGSRTEQMYAASSAIAPGQRLSADDLQVVEVGLSELASGYLAVGDLPSDGFVVTRAIQAGELIPVSALGAPDTSRSSIIVEVTGGLSSELGVGSPVELWASRETEPGTYGPPTLTSAQATVARVLPGEGALTAQQSDRVELLLPKAEIPAVLAATSNEARLALVPIYLAPGE